MKKVNLGKLNLQSEEVLDKSQMAKINGGAGWMCFCGNEGSYGGGGTYFEGDSQAAGQSALYYMANICGGSATCFHV
ncbi:TIGR04149 family rSAM-modified RiPP [Algoriphagus aestuarii]|nr:TIGR04149 family rSAM-modified RiPP [Algoriphagus aestuarii]